MKQVPDSEVEREYRVLCDHLDRLHAKYHFSVTGSLQAPGQVREERNVYRDRKHQLAWARWNAIPRLVRLAMIERAHKNIKSPRG